METVNIQAEVSRCAPQEAPRNEEDCGLERWQIDSKTARLTFTLHHLVIQEIRGQFRSWGGTLFLDRAEPWLSSVHVWVDLASIETDSVERDAHVLSAEFLDVARFPRAEFQSTAVEPSDQHLLVRGRLQLHGVTHDLDLEVETGTGKDGAARYVYSVRGKIDRQRFGLHWNQDLDAGGAVVGDEIEMSAEVSVMRAGDGPD